MIFLLGFKRKCALSFAFWFCLGAVPVLAQETSSRFIQERLVENQRQQELEKYLKLRPEEKAALVEAKKLLLDFGGWVDLIYTEFHNDDNNRSEKDTFDANLSVDTKIWFQGKWRPRLGSGYVYEHSIFAQVSNFYIARWPNDDPLVKDDNDGPHVDLLYGEADLRYAKIRVGRQFLNLGRGISYSNIHDGIRWLLPLSDWEIMGFVSTTLPYEENIDYSVPGFDKTSERFFTGSQVSWRPKEELEFYSYFLVQDDQSDPQPLSNQDFVYRSQYWSLGAEVYNLYGLSGWTEYILETGSSAVFGSGERKPVLAHAANVGASYRTPRRTKPEISMEYAFGSGDRDRTSVTNTEGGNVLHKDHNFLGFGVYPSGYALAPILSNIHILKLSGSVAPLDSFWQLEQLRTSLDLYLYWKNKQQGGIYDIDATDDGRSIGQEMDVTLYWPVLSDVTFSVRYGVFFPGSAYPRGANDSEHHVSTLFTFRF